MANEMFPGKEWGDANGPTASTEHAMHQVGPLLCSQQSGSATFDSGQSSIGYAISLPDNYTPSYAYPLIVWFHDDGLDEADVMHWLPRISPQNYLGIGLRAPVPVVNDIPGRARWSTGEEHVQWLQNDLAMALQDVFERLSIHPERIVTAGIGQGGTMALQMLLSRPEWFAGAIALNAALPAHWRLDWWGQYHGRRLWLGQSELLAPPAGQAPFRCVRTLHTAGFDITQRIYDPDQWPLDTFGREIDRWLMHALCGDTVIA